MIKIAHEAPKYIFHKVNELTDYSYALVHLFEEDEEYYKLFEDALADGREVILDNSIFELEEAFDADRFAYWVNKLKPTWYIVPDTLEDYQKTINQMRDWNKVYSDLPGKKIGVVQGKTYQEIVTCYEYMNKEANVDMIAISFDYSYYQDTFYHPNKYVSWMMGRVNLLGALLRDGIINVDKPHHLLGSALYWEGEFYKKYPWIYSIDTSNPVVFGIKDREYNGLTWDKPSEKLFTLINLVLDDIQLQKVISNIKDFQERWRQG